MTKLELWNARVSSADTSEGVLRVVRDYISQLGPEEIAELPTDCRPGSMENATDVSDYAFRLVQAECTSYSFNGLGVAAIARFFASAAQRLAHIVRFSEKLREAREAAAERSDTR